jgi:hypothetical protein
MTRKDYEVIAGALRSAMPPEPDVGAPVTTDYIAACARFNQWQYAATKLADALKSDNDRFDRARFLAAAGVQ